MRKFLIIIFSVISINTQSSEIYLDCYQEVSRLSVDFMLNLDKGNNTAILFNPNTNYYSKFFVNQKNNCPDSKICLKGKDFRYFYFWKINKINTKPNQEYNPFRISMEFIDTLYSYREFFYLRCYRYD